MKSTSFVLLAWMIGFSSLCSDAAWAAFPQSWKNVQELHIDQAGLVKISLPLASIDAARQGLEDLRLVNAVGQEIPYLLERPTQSQAVSWPVRDFRAAVEPESTVVEINVDGQGPLKAVSLETPGEDFIKAVRVEGLKSDGEEWQALGQGIPIYRLPKRAGRLLVEIPPREWSRLRLTLDDRRSPPIPVTAVRLYAAEALPAPSEEFLVAITERSEDLQETRLTLQAAGSHITLASLSIETPEVLFTRPVTLSYRQYLENAVHETVLAAGTLFRVAVDGLPAVSNLSLASDIVIPSRELFLTIDNGDNPPLQISRISAQRRPIYLTFLAPDPGAYYCLTGNPQSPAPNYDLSAQRERLQNAALVPVRAGTLTVNPDYRATDLLPEVQAGGVLDVSAWKYRKRLQLAGAGVQQLNLDLEVLSRAISNTQDLRLIEAEKQLPFVLERTTISRVIVPEVSAADDPKRPHTSRWMIRMPLPGLPMKRFTTSSGTPYFKRQVRLIEEVADERGVVHQRLLQSSQWVKTLQQKEARLDLAVSHKLAGDRLLLEIDNGDNPPLILKEVQLWYPLTRLLFRVGDPAAEVFLYYGNPRAVPPQYDLDVIAPQLLEATKSPAAGGPEETLQKPSWKDRGLMAGSAGAVFWVTLVVVVVVLLYVIARLLPGAAETKGKE